MRFLTLILLLVLSDISFGQAVWKGYTYNAPVCNKPNCQMCNAIRAQLAAQQAPTPQYTQPQVQSQQYTTVYETQAVTKTVKRCNGRTCWYENVTEYVQVARQVPVQSNVSFRNDPPPVVQNTAPTPAPLLNVTELVPTPPEAVDILIRLLSPKSTDIFIEPGCGDGRVIKEVGKYCTALGIELNVTTAETARKNVGAGAIVITGNALSLDYSSATIVYMYLYPDLMNKIIPLLNPGTKIVSYCHSVPGIKWQEHTEKGHTFYIGTK